MRKFLVLAAFFLAACDNTSAELAAQDARNVQMNCQIHQEEMDRLDAEVLRPGYELHACVRDTERYRELVGWMNEDHCPDFRSSNLDPRQCPELPAENEVDQ